MTDEQLNQLLQQQQMLIEKLVKSKEKDLWDKLSTFSTILSSVVLAAVGVYFTNAYKAQEVRVAEAQVIEKLVTDLSGTNENAKKGALLTAATLSNKDLAARLGALYASPGTIDALEMLFKTAQGDSKDVLRDTLIDGYFNRGLDEIEKKNYYQAVEDYNRIFALRKPNDLKDKNGGYFLANAYMNRGVGYAALGKYDLSLADYKGSLEIIHDYGMAYWNLGTMYWNRNDAGKSTDEALRYYDLAVKFGAEPLVYLDRGNLHLVRNEIDMAIADFSTFLSGASDYGAHRARATAYEQKGDFGNAKNDLMSARALATDPKVQKEIDDELKKIGQRSPK